MMNYTNISILFCLFLSAACVMTQSGPVGRIDIVSSWTGLGVKERGELIVTRNAGGYMVDGKKISDDLIVNLLRAINSPVVTTPNPARLGITQKWLDDNTEKAFRKYYSLDVDRNKQARFYSLIKSSKFIEEVLPKIFDTSHIHTDDFPKVEIEISENDGRSIKVLSRAQSVFMLPWIISRDGEKVITYNPDIGRAVAALAGEKFPNKERLAGSQFIYELAQEAYYEIENR